MNKSHIPYVAFIFLLTALLAVQQCVIKKRNTVIEDYKAIEQFNKSSLDSLKNKLNQTVYESKVAETNSKKIIKELSDEVFQLKEKDAKRVKEVTALVREIQKLKLTPPVIHYTDTGSKKPPEFYTNDSLVHKDSVVIPPRKFYDSTEHYTISGTVLLEGVRLDSVTAVDTSSYRFIEQKPKGFFNKLTKPNELVIQNMHSNPYIKTIGIQSIIVKPSQSKWNKWLKPAIAIGTGIFIGSKL